MRFSMRSRTSSIIFVFSSSLSKRCKTVLSVFLRQIKPCKIKNTASSQDYRYHAQNIFLPCETAAPQNVYIHQLFLILQSFHKLIVNYIFNFVTNRVPATPRVSASTADNFRLRQIYWYFSQNGMTHKLSAP